METIITKSADETKKVANNFAQSLVGGEIICLNGDLGAGKTTFCQGLARGLGVLQNVNSPTFVIMKIYPIDSGSYMKKLIHIDAYRLGSAKDLDSVGAIEHLGQADTITLIEWADNIKEILPKKIIYIDISGTQDERAIKINQN